MKISVITINYNDRDGLAKTMESVLSQTARLGVDYEYIVVDGGSSDGSAEVMAQYADKLAYGVSEPDGGIFNAMNKGIKAASGDYLNFMNAGDYFAAPDVLERVVKKLDGKDFYIGHQQNLKPHAHLIKAPRRISACSLVVQPLPHQATFIRSALLKARGYNEQFKVIADWEQMVVEFLVNNRTYERLDFVVASTPQASPHEQVMTDAMKKRDSACCVKLSHPASLRCSSVAAVSTPKCATPSTNPTSGSAISKSCATCSR